ncbi:MAG: hypothetical protein Q8M03_14090 [Legionella sp.]|nr:hypothetical protein [Legionella sp.]
MNTLSAGNWHKQGTTVPDQLGLYALFLLIILNPFHFFLFDKVVYYRELLALIFFGLCCQKFFSCGKSIFNQTYAAQTELFFILLFPALLLFFAMFDPGRNLYEVDITGASLHLKTVNPALYVLRNAFLYIPMVVYLALRGLTEQEINKLALITVLIAPISVLSFLYHEQIATIFTLPVLTKLGGGSGLNYNSYVPYLTFPALSAMYLMGSASSSKFVKLISLAILIVLFVYICLSTSRQSVLFVVLSAVVFFLYNRESSLVKKLMFLSIAVLCIFISLQALNRHADLKNASEVELHQRMVDKYVTLGGAISTPRIKILQHGLSLLHPSEYLTGAGLSSVINSGPHNDYVRWMQRVGILVMFIGFVPFFLALGQCYRRNYFIKNNALTLYILLSIMFTLYHSFFGYPREDAYQAIYCFLGLAVFCGIKKDSKFVLSSRLINCNMSMHKHAMY